MRPPLPCPPPAAFAALPAKPLSAYPAELAARGFHSQAAPALAARLECVPARFPAARLLCYAVQRFLASFATFARALMRCAPTVLAVAYVPYVTELVCRIASATVRPLDLVLCLQR